MVQKNLPPITPLFFCLASLFVTCLLVSNIIAGKLIQVKGLILPAAVILFPLAYILGDVLTEVYGFKRSRLVIWTGFAASAFMSFIFILTVALPYPQVWENQAAYTTVLGFTPRLVLASLMAYLFGEFTNAVLLSKMKIMTQGRWLWLRTIGSSIVGQSVDTVLFISIAFWGILTPSLLVGMLVAQYFWKVGYEIVATPLTYALVKGVKKRENIDVFDYNLRYNPFSLEVEDESV